MCFRATPHHTAKLRNRVKPMHFFKVVLANSRKSKTCTWRRGDPYLKGSIVQAYAQNGVRMKKRRHVIGKPTTMSGGIYVYKMIARAVMEAVAWNGMARYQLIVVECRPEDVIGANASMACFTKVRVLS